MRIEIPDCARCCACIPLRFGIIIFGYLNLAFTLLILASEIYLIVAFYKEYTIVDSLQSYTIFMYRGVGLLSQTWFIFILYILEIIFNVILLFGAHTKRTKPIRIYYYYGITTCVSTFLCYVVVRKDIDYGRSFDYYITEFCFAFAGLVFHVYLLLLIRSELKKLDKKKQLCFVNHTAEVFVDQLNNDFGRNPL